MIARRPRPPMRAQSTAMTVAAPTLGWNARDALANMNPQDAVYLENLFPSPTSVAVRSGYIKWATGITGTVETIFQYSGGATQKKFAAAGTQIYNVTASGAVGAADVTALTNARWQYVNNTTAGGSYLQAVNGADKMQVYDGSAWHKDGDGAPYDVTGVNTQTCIGITLSHNRVWFVQSNTLKAWYLPTGAIGGAATAFDISSFCYRGGYLMAMATWTMDAGYGMDDMTVFITSEGEVLVYRGTDPASSTTWSLIGNFWIGSPIGRRCAIKFAGDLLLITQDGVISMAAALQSSRVNPKAALSNKIQYAISQAISSYQDNYGWQLVPFPRENMLILNVPIQEGQGQQQYVMSTIKRGNGDWAWCNFTGWEASCWELCGDDIFFGGSTYVAKAWSGYADNNTNITTNGLQAFNDFGNDKVQKRFTMMRPILQSDGSPSVNANMNIDFDLTDPIATLTFVGMTYGVWDTALWDAGIWGGGTSVLKNWQGCTGIGYWAAPHLKTASKDIQTAWVNTTVVYEGGGIL